MGIKIVRVTENGAYFKGLYEVIGKRIVPGSTELKIRSLAKGSSFWIKESLVSVDAGCLAQAKELQQLRAAAQRRAK